MQDKKREEDLMRETEREREMAFSRPNIAWFIILWGAKKTKATFLTELFFQPKHLQPRGPGKQFVISAPLISHAKKWEKNMGPIFSLFRKKWFCAGGIMTVWQATKTQLIHKEAFPFRQY